MEPSIFRPYDIRGKYPEEINEQVAEEIAIKIGKLVKSKSKADIKIIIGRDVRNSSPSLYKSLILGLKKAGISKSKIIDAGLITTPMFYFLSSYFKTNFGFMITSSHGPKDTNGIKTIGEKTAFISGEDVKKIILGK